MCKHNVLNWAVIDYVFASIFYHLRAIPAAAAASTAEVPFSYSTLERLGAVHRSPDERWQA